jgi:CheY-specific phosphatase CheX
MTEVRTVDEWLNAAVTAAEELATVALGFDGAFLVGKKDVVSPELDFAMVALVSDTASVQLGIASSKDGCQSLARALLAMEPEEDDLPDEDVADAVGEVVNIVAGQVKSLMSDADASIKIGLPLFVHGRIDYPDDVENAFADVNVGPVPVTFVVLKSSN